MSSHLGSSEDKDQVWLQFYLLQASADGNGKIITGYNSSQDGVNVGRDSRPLWANLYDAKVFCKNEVCAVVWRENRAGALSGPNSSQTCPPQKTSHIVSSDLFSSV